METIGYFLRRYREDIVRNKNRAKTIGEQLKKFENRCAARSCATRWTPATSMAAAADPPPGARSTVWVLPKA